MLWYQPGFVCIFLAWVVIQCQINIWFPAPSLQLVSSTLLTAHDSCCVSIQGLHSSEEHRRPFTSQRCTKAVLIRRLPTNVVFPVFGGCTAISLRDPTYPKILCVAKKEKRKKTMATSRGVGHHIRGPGWQKSWHKGKTSGDATRKCSKGSTVTLTRSLWRTHLRRPQRPSPSKDADPKLRHSNWIQSLDWSYFHKTKLETRRNSLAEQPDDQHG